MPVVDIMKTDKKYNIIYDDPPWQYQVWSRDTGLGRSAESHYKTMKKEDIQKLPIENICAKDCVLFLWVTAPCLLEGLELVQKWGFEYKTFGFTWIKTNKKSDSLFWGMRFNMKYVNITSVEELIMNKNKSFKGNEILWKE